ncbi:MAG: SurA N-terminal domain-containing protein [Nitrospirae bacterium]|nr:SurA N-terminal domain-containing protein [Nitrospirota bacterium]
MLKVMGSHKFFSVFVLGAVTFMIIITFVFWGIGGSGPSSERAGIVAEIKGEPIPVEEFWRAYDNEYKRVKEMYPNEEEIKKLNLKENVLNALIDRKVIVMAAQEAGITVTEQELQNEILQLPYFQRNGVFDQNIYERSLQLNRLTPQTFEEQLKNDLLFTKMSRLIQETVEFSSTELQTIDSLKQSNNQIAEAFRNSKNSQALKAYVEGIKRKMEIKVNKDLIS